MTVDDPGDDVGEVVQRIDVVDLAGLDQRRNGGPMFGSAVGPCEQRILSGQCHYPNILPISGGKSRSITNGIRCFAAAFVGITASGAPLVILFTSRSRRER